MKAPTALRHQHGHPPIEFFILNANADGTIDLGDEEGNLVIGKCKVSDTPQPGFATLVGDSKLPPIASALASVPSGDVDRKIAELIEANERLEKQGAQDQRRIKDLEVQIKAKTVVVDQLQKQLDDANKQIAAAPLAAGGEVVGSGDPAAQQAPGDESVAAPQASAGMGAKTKAANK